MQVTEWIPAPENWQSLKPHPLSEVVNFGVGIDMEGLARHMADHGYDESEPIVLFRDMVLDGRHKQAAAKAAGVTPVFARFVGKSAEAYVAKKAFRQHLNASQRAMIAATISDLGKNLKQICGRENLSETLNVSERTLQDAAKVVKQGTPELNGAVVDGTVSVSDAAKVVDETPAKQKKAVLKVRKKKAKTLREAIDQEKETEEEHEDKSAEDVMKDRNSEIESFCRKITKIVDEEMPHDEWIDDNMNRRQSVIQKFKDACATLRAAKCSHVCPMCKGSGCKDCHKTGRVPTYQYQQLV